MKNISVIIIAIIIAISFAASSFACDKNPNSPGNGYAYAWGKNKKSDSVRKNFMETLSRNKMILAQVGYSELGNHKREVDATRANCDKQVSDKNTEIAALKSKLVAMESQLAQANAKLTATEVMLLETQTKLTDSLVEREFECPTVEIAAAPMAAMTFIEEAAPAIESEEIPQAELRKFAISRLADGNVSVYTNHFVNWDTETMEKVLAMDPGQFKIEVKVIDQETNLEVKIQSDAEAYDFDKTGYDWFIGLTING